MPQHSNQQASRVAAIQNLLNPTECECPSNASNAPSSIEMISAGTGNECQISTKLEGLRSLSGDGDSPSTRYTLYSPISQAESVISPSVGSISLSKSVISPPAGFISQSKFIIAPPVESTSQPESIISPFVESTSQPEVIIAPSTISTSQPQYFTCDPSSSKASGIPTPNAAAQSPYGVMLLQTAEGPIPVPLDMESGSKDQERKRKQNTTISNRARQRRKIQQETSKLAELEAQLLKGVEAIQCLKDLALEREKSAGNSERYGQRRKKQRPQAARETFEMIAKLNAHLLAAVQTNGHVLDVALRPRPLSWCGRDATGKAFDGAPTN